ncbi:MucR family transcriptional regulator [Arenibaculum pallidiluteum]|uniref:MucR family transcriptional regulator n=1 Tax=Arenibaculum pallidiluteum TaxID=2812559 RepID=UPI001A965B48|nr:MucR family transcriptional regulator [Arenibaculum pallidiluteum]
MSPDESAQSAAPDLIALTAEITAAYLRGNAIPAPELPDVITAVFASLKGLGQAEPVEKAQEPAVPIKRSVTPSAIACLECGKKQKMLKRHLIAAHGMGPQGYRAKWGLPAEYPMTAPAYAAQRSELAKATGLGKRPRDKAKQRRSSTRGRAAKAS